LYVVAQGVTMKLRFGGKPYPPEAGSILSLSQRTATVPLLLCRGDRRHRACMFKVGDKSESVDCGRDGSRAES